MTYVLRIRNTKTNAVKEYALKGSYEQLVEAGKAKVAGKPHLAYSVVSKG